jgi:hypothetical protein
MKKRIIIQISLFLILPLLISAQESQENKETNSIFCAQFDIVVNGFEVSESAFICVCCGEPFAEGTTPCKIISKSNYESFSGQSDEAFKTEESGFIITELLLPVKKKLAKIKTVEVVESSIATVGNTIKVAIKKGNYTIDDEGKIWLEVEYLK